MTKVKANSNGHEEVTASGTQFSVKKRRGPGRPFPKGHPWRYPKGVSGNPGGRPRGLSAAYRAWLAAINPRDKLKRTNAEVLAAVVGQRAIAGDVEAARELRVATEGGVTLSFTKMSDADLAALIVAVDGSSLLQLPAAPLPPTRGDEAAGGQ